MTPRKDSHHFLRLKEKARPILLPLLQKLGWRRRKKARLPRISVRDLVPQSEAPTKVSVREDQTILLNGAPFFPIGLYYAQDEIDDASGEGLAALRSMGFNTIFFRGGLESESQLDQIRRAGLYVCYRPPGELYREFVLLKEVISKFARHPALLFWEMDDEPVLNQVNFSEAEKGCRIVKSIDPYHPILCTQWLSNLDQAEEMRRWANLADVNGFSTYPVPSWRWGKRMSLVEEGWPHSIVVVGKQTDVWRSYAPSKPVIPVLQAWAWNCLEDSETAYPTYQECRFMAYQAVIHGAKGLHHYGAATTSRPNFACGIPPKIHEDLDQTHTDFLKAQEYNRQFWSYYSNVIKELSCMSAVFASNNAKWTTEIKYRSPLRSGEHSVECGVKQNLDSYVVMLVNASDVSAPIDVRAEVLQGRVLKVWGQRRSVQVNSDGIFQDIVEPYGVRIYSDQPDLLEPLS